jgi:hypothetical protein
MNKTTLRFICSMTLLMAVNAWAAPVPDTGQTKCYNVAGHVITCPSPGQALYGQDANYTINPMSYTKLDAAGNALPDSATSWTMVKDNVTGLIWEMKTNKDGTKNYNDPHDADNTYTWYDSNPATNGGYAGTPGDGTDTEDFIKALNDAHYGGNSDWRMPTVKELMSIVDIFTSFSGPAINTVYFPNTVSDIYWSSTTESGRTNHALGLHFFFGESAWPDKSGSYYVRAVRGGQSGSSGILAISPVSRSVPKDAGNTTFSVSNTGTGTMPWTASVTSGGDWLTIISGASGTNTGTITCAFTANTGTINRKATIRVTTTGATGSPADVTVTQAANTTQCTATFDSNLALHIPLISHLVPYWGAPSYTADMVYEYNAAYPAMILFKLTHADLAQSGVYLCDPATVSDELLIHLPDVLLPDGITRMWLDLTYSPALSTSGVCFYVSNYGAAAK